MLEIRDTGLMPEGEMLTRNQKLPSFDFAQSNEYPVEEILKAANISTSADKSKLNQITKFMQHEDATIRYWGVTGCLILGDDAKGATIDLEKLLNDESPDVRITAAEVLCNLGKTEKATAVLIEALNDDNLMVPCTCT